MTETVAAIVAAHRAGTATPAQTVARSYQRIRDHNDPAIFISLRDQQQALAKRYADLFRVYHKHRADIERVTFWGVTDGDSWLNSRDRINYPLLFDRNGQPKPAFDAVIKAAQDQ